LLTYVLYRTSKLRWSVDVDLSATAGVERLKRQQSRTIPEHSRAFGVTPPTFG
jgi:hypothetical protein